MSVSYRSAVAGRFVSFFALRRSRLWTFLMHVSPALGCISAPKSPGSRNRIVWCANEMCSPRNLAYLMRNKGSLWFHAVYSILHIYDRTMKITHLIHLYLYLVKMYTLDGSRQREEEDWCNLLLANALLRVRARMVWTQCLFHTAMVCTPFW